MIEQDKKPVIKAVAYEVRHEPEDEYDFGYSETRYRLVNMDTGEIVDDAQGYGYKTAAGAHRAYGYKSMPKSRKRKIASVKERARRFREDNPSFVDSRRTGFGQVDCLVFHKVPSKTIYFIDTIRRDDDPQKIFI